MYYDEESGAPGFMAGMLVGALIGAGIALLTSPHNGRMMRAKLIRRDSASDLELDDDDGGEEEHASIIDDLKRRRHRRGR